jgi:hypothetical protein
VVGGGWTTGAVAEGAGGASGGGDPDGVRRHEAQLPIARRAKRATLTARGGFEYPRRISLV